ncbi:gamma-glutamyltranspeptidase/glutathione hydrolase [Lewinella marina]|uniref:Glutathione hydrolase proenzyme n=1 Tax=Neolewinella marina TaxID=438751 RepID=A0A2G0CHV3_9BACT|nr:gamma-glutamyltransferase [Neolewinella marina]NJB85335.1 gamma-glutamyltranspeptidase/glutathione hydrolase [Neolewinella marina]PHK99549.1 gamma-glutamyltransferase [Neolewinella marina]
MRYPLLLSTLLFVLQSPLTGQDRVTGALHATRSEVLAANGMVATSHPLATQIGLQILKDGGNAIDAAIAANAALGLMEPTGCGIGGDLFAIVWDAETQRVYGLNASGRSPLGMTLADLQAKGLNKIPALGPLPVSVPGAVDGWYSLHERFGSRPMPELLAPAIRYAEDGFPLTELIAWYMQQSITRYMDEGFPNIRETYIAQNGGTLPGEGDIYRNPYLANTYRRIAQGGRDAFYKGEIAATIAGFIQQQGGYLSEEDLAAHQSEWVEPVSVNYRGYDVWELPPNGQGIAALQMLAILEGFDFSGIDFGSAEHLHLFTEAKKLAFEDRARYYADMDFADVPVDWLISEEYAGQRREQLSDRASVYTAGQISAGETIYLTTADSAGNMVSLIQSNYRGMGSGMVPPGLGFMLQDRGELFSLTPGQANTYAPGKRPFHTIIPAFISQDGKPWVSFGVMGGDFQPQGHAQIVMNLIDFGMNLQEAGDAPRWDHTGGSSPTGAGPEEGQVRVESGIPYETIRGLMDRGHSVGFTRGSYGGYQAILRDPANGVYHGASESRKDGQAAGY